MTDCTGTRYWSRRIGEAKERYNRWCQRRQPKGASGEDWLKWHEWRQARIDYFNSERSKLHGYSPKRTDIVRANTDALNQRGRTGGRKPQADAAAS